MSRTHFEWERLVDPRLPFDFDEAHNVPTLYSSFALMLCAALLVWIGRCHQLEGASHRYGFGLAAVFGSRSSCSDWWTTRSGRAAA